MFLYWIIILVYAVFSIYDWKKAIICWIPIRMLFNSSCVEIPLS